MFFNTPTHEIDRSNQKQKKSLMVRAYWSFLQCDRWLDEAELKLHFDETQLFSEMGKNNWFDEFGQNVSDHLADGHIARFDEAVFGHLSDVMILNVDMFDAIMMLRVFDENQSALIVFKKLNKWVI